MSPITTKLVQGRGCVAGTRLVYQSVRHSRSKTLALDFPGAAATQGKGDAAANLERCGAWRAAERGGLSSGVAGSRVLTVRTR
ncbi:hypothetical protein E2C01_022793 [Portunus trituberculatus]|uniref:Uncharacterized protein n=1 Tax=Portunus trituberculatus TaxID=210409 RepID=A0A5B7E6B9_PORTR|nr:hypothetical protein [Portunus trituberculatus]